MTQTQEGLTVLMVRWGVRIPLSLQTHQFSVQLSQVALIHPRRFAITGVLVHSLQRFSLQILLLILSAVS
jgi:hypothetical protein